MTVTIVDVTPENAIDEGFFCIKSPKHPGFASKRTWFAERHAEGLRLKLLRDDVGQQIAFIEYVPAEYAWRPVIAPNYMFIHCISGYGRVHRGKGYASLLLEACEEDALIQHKCGVAVMTSDGAWMASRQIYLKRGYTVVDGRGRFELLVRKFDLAAEDPCLIDWESRAVAFAGWHLIYADQCPWHVRAACELSAVARAEGIDLTITKITSAEQARHAPSGSGVFGLVYDGELLEDHYISATRFRSIVRRILC